MFYFRQSLDIVCNGKSSELDRKPDGRWAAEVNGLLKVLSGVSQCALKRNIANEDRCAAGQSVELLDTDVCADYTECMR